MSQIITEGERALVKVEKDLDASVAQELRGRLRSLVENGTKELVIDLTGVDRIDSMGLGLLISARNSMEKNGGSFSVANTSENIQTVFRNMRLDRHISLVDA